MPWKPTTPGEVPTLGFLAIDWIAEYLAAPDRGEYEPFRLYDEQEEFVLRFYELDPRTGRRRRRRGVISRPRGWGKSPLLAALCAFEALGPACPDGWDADGQPVGKPWNLVRTPLVQIGAITEEQAKKNTWGPLLEMLDHDRVLREYPGLEPLDTFVNLPPPPGKKTGGKIQPITASADSAKGNKPIFAILDQTEVFFPSNGGVKLARTVLINATKVGGHVVESPNAFTPGTGSVAEISAMYWEKIQRGKARNDGLYYDHREAPADTDLEDPESLMRGLVVAYGDSADRNGGHVDLDHIAGSIQDPLIDPQTSRADYLNQITHASDSWLSRPEWNACADRRKYIAPGDTIVLGFDGSLRRSRRITDATALIGCRVSDGHLFQIRVWEQPDGPEGHGWEAPRDEVDQVVRETFERYKVVGFFADPAKWESYIADWEAAYNDKLLVKASRNHPIEWWMTGGRARLIVRATEAFENAVKLRELTHDGAWALSRHVINARNRIGTAGLQIAKPHPESDQKIDAAVAAILAWQARLAAIAAGLALPQEEVTAGGYTF